jgi:hypothetical protein
MCATRRGTESSGSLTAYWNKLEGRKQNLPRLADISK